MKVRQMFVPAVLSAGLLLFASCAGFAEEPGQDGQDLEQAANDPTASLMSVQIQNVYAGDYHNLKDEDGNTILVRSAVPFKTGPLNHIARATLPVVTENPARKDGLSDLVLFDLIVFNQSWGRWGVGPVMLFPTATNDALGADKWAAGPARGSSRAARSCCGAFSARTFLRLPETATAKTSTSASFSRS